MKRRVAVFFGGRSPEHDVSVITGLQVLRAVDQQQFDAFPVYISTRGEWLIGEGLADRRNYLPDPALRAKLTEVTLDLGAQTGGVLLPKKSGLFSKPAPVTFDVALLAFHGAFGEDGPIQGVFEIAGVPYTGTRVLASALLMDKAATKQALAGLDIPLLPHAVVERPRQGLIPAAEALQAAIARVPCPAIVKPVHLGSSIGVAKVDSAEELRAVLPTIFALDPTAMVEPFVPNLVEYNVAVSAFGGTIRTSAIERPKRTAELLDFRQKYLSGGKGKGGSKVAGESSQGMLSLTRDIAPKLPEAMERNIRAWATKAFVAVGGTGAPRIDFLCNEASGEIWLNEVNPCPGSFGYFLWEAAAEPLHFTPLITALIEEAVAQQQRRNLPADPVPAEARLLRRP